MTKFSLLHLKFVILHLKFVIIPKLPFNDLFNFLLLLSYSLFIYFTTFWGPNYLFILMLEKLFILSILILILKYK